MLDTSPDCNNFSDGPCHQGESWPDTATLGPMKDQLRENFGIAAAQSAAAKGSAWWITHKPLWDFAGGNQRYGGWTVAMSRLLDEAVPKRLCRNGECAPSTVVAGHQHYLQRIRFPGGNGWSLPQQYMVGNGGVTERSVAATGDRPGYTKTCQAFTDAPATQACQ